MKEAQNYKSAQKMKHQLPKVSNPKVSYSQSPISADYPAR